MHLTILNITLICMTAAFGCYLMAFLFSGKKTSIHVSFALLGFTLDLFATYLMEKYGRSFVENFSSVLLYAHTTFALCAIILFLTVAYLGARRHPKHPFIAKFLFLPTWITSYILGVMLII